jgi:ABC-type lipoprotein export system ATPase subunit
MPSPTPLFSIAHVSKVFAVKSQAVTVLNDVSLTIQAGDFLILFGPSGCGKSTLLHVLLGLEAPTEGTVLVEGSSLYASPDEDIRSEFRKQRIGMVYQQPNWIKSLTVKENVMFGLRLKGLSPTESESTAKTVLALVGMTEWLDYIPTELSSGQQQKVALARAIATNPDSIIADEPTGNLDFESGQELMKLITSLNSQGKTIIMVTHDLEYLSYASRAVEMFNGRIVQEIANPATYTQQAAPQFKRRAAMPQT